MTAAWTILEYKLSVKASPVHTDALVLACGASPCPEYSFTASKDQLKYSVCVRECVCSLTRERERGSLVCRPQIYGAVTLTEASTFSSAARSRQREAFYRHALIHPDLSLCPSDLPLLFQPSGFPSSTLICTFKARFPPFMSQSSSSFNTSQTLETNWTKQKAVTSACLLLCSPTVHVLVVLFRATEELDFVPACTGEGLFKTDKPTSWFDLLFI